jgi:hypothetical protein
LFCTLLDPSGRYYVSAPPFAPTLQVILVLAPRRRRGYRARVEAELSGIYVGILRLLDERLVPAAVAVDARVFYLKM